MNIPRKYLTEKIILVESVVDANEIIKILLQDKTAKMNGSSTDQNILYYQNLINKVTSGYKQQKNGKKSEIILANLKLSKRAEAERLGLKDRYTSLGALLNTLKDLMEAKGKYNPSNPDSNVIQITTLEILAGLTGTKLPEAQKPEDPWPEDPNDPDTEEPIEPEEPSVKIKDWTAEKAKRLAKPNGKQTSEILKKFYDDYYSQEYAGVESPDKDTTGIVTTLKSLDKILTQEFNKLGYNPDVNPFAQFLKILIKLKKESRSTIFDKLTLNTYGAIHNAFLRKLITGNMLGNHKEDGTGDNILFCEDLYSHKGLTILNYLSLQKQTLDGAKTKYPDTQNIVARLFIKQRQASDDYATNAKSLITRKKLIPVESPSAKLKSELEVSELYNHLFSAEAKKLLSEDAIKDIVISAKNNKAILEMANYLLELIKLQAVKLPADHKVYTDWLGQEKLSYSLDDFRTSWCKEVLNRYVLDDITNLMTLVKKLALAYKNGKESSDKENKGT